RVDPAQEEAQRRRLAEVRAGRDQERTARALAELESAARTEAPLMEPVLAAVRGYCTLGEICGVLRKVFGEYR
ncbi:MAG: methylmalonyl-CoA mutase family protein, partial [Thermodesulfobacteriota bacterium]